MKVRGTQINYCIQCGTKLKLIPKLGKLRPVCPKCGWTYFPDPKVAAAILIEKDEQVLLVRRVHSPRKGLWTLPVGFVDAGEDPAKAAERECLEETGLVVRVTGLIDIIAGQEYPGGAHFVIVYRGEIISGRLTASDDVDKAAFFDKKNLPPLAFETALKVLAP